MKALKQSSIKIITITWLLAAVACSTAMEDPTPFPRPELLQFINPQRTPLPPGVTPLPPERVNLVDELISKVSAQNLISKVESLSKLQSRHVNSDTIFQAAEMIYAEFQSAGGNLIVTYQEFELEYDNITSIQRNVIARLPGSDPSAGVIVIGAHYDSRGSNLNNFSVYAPGANDNATGVAALLEIARLLANETPVATIDLVAFSAEEIGMVGSANYLQSMLSRGDIIRGAIILDIIGNGAGIAGKGIIRAFSSPPDTSISRQLAHWVSSVAQVYTPGFIVQVEPLLDRPGRFSDHIPFTQAGIPAIRLIEVLESTEKQHTGDDLAQYLDQEYLRQATQLALAVVINLAYGYELPAAR